MDMLPSTLLCLLVRAAAPTDGGALEPLDPKPLPHGYPQSHRQKICLNTDWRFHLGDPDLPLYEAELDDSGWEEVSLPHTLKLTSLDLDGCRDDKTQQTFHRTVGWYRKPLWVGDDDAKKVFLEFEGAHQVTDLWVNGEHVGQHAVGGYTPFHFDVSDAVRRGGENQVTLRVDNRVREDAPPDPGPFDYVKFSGLYRDVYAVSTDPMHITFNWEALDAGVFITTPVVDPVNMNAVVDVRTVVRNEYDEAREATVVTRVIDANGLVVLKRSQTETVFPGHDQVFRQNGALEDDLHLWSIDDPYLYRVNSMVMVDGKPVDALENRLGVRSFTLDPVRGFLLNRQPITLIGSNRHQHYGYVGDALPNALHYKDMLQFKELGFNVVRTAHYPQDDALLEACDELGILVYEEAPTWISISQVPAWYDHYEAATRVMIRNHRNHPSVVIWGAGINHRGPVPGAVLAAKQEDPSRLTASQASRWTGWQTSGLCDIFANMMYGSGIWDRSEPLLAMEGGRGPAAIASYQRDPLKTGMISWTAHAYYTFHPTRNVGDRTRSGMMTVFRRPKRGVMWYPAEMRKEPYLHIEDEWKEGVSQVSVYSNAEQVELVVNGHSFMKQGPSTDAKYEGLEHPPFHFAIDRFEPGELTARGLNGDTLIASQTVHTPGEPRGVRLVMDTAGREFTADGADILVGHAYVVDAKGTICTDAKVELRFDVQGPASVVGDGMDIGANPVGARNGAAPVLVRAGKEAGKVTVTARAEGLEPSSITVATTTYDPDMIAAGAKPIYDFQAIRVDLGSHEQLLQFGWTPWNGTDNQPSKLDLDVMGGITASLKPVSEDGILRWLGEMNVIGKYGYAYGDGVVAVDPRGLALQFAGLAQGIYRIRTWHHAPRSNTDSMDPNRERLKSQTIHALPYARELTLSVSDAGPGAEVKTRVSEGKEMQTQPVATAELRLVSDGVGPVTVTFEDPRAEKGIWLNAFELSEWHEDLD